MPLTKTRRGSVDPAINNVSPRRHACERGVIDANAPCRAYCWREYKRSRASPAYLRNPVSSNRSATEKQALPGIILLINLFLKINCATRGYSPNNLRQLQLFSIVNCSFTSLMLLDPSSNKTNYVFAILYSRFLENKKFCTAEKNILTQKRILVWNVALS